MSEIISALKEAKEKATKRKFIQSVDLAVNLKSVDLKNPENRFRQEVLLTHGKGRPARIGVIGSHLASGAKGYADMTITESELDAIEKDKKIAKKLVETTDFFVSEPQLMARLGKSMGKIMGPRGKMPKPLPGNVDPKPMIGRLKNTVTLSLSQSPVVHCCVGSEVMEDKQIEDNVNAVLHALEQKLPQGRQNIRSMYLKLTMGPSIKVK